MSKSGAWTKNSNLCSIDQIIFALCFQYLNLETLNQRRFKAKVEVTIKV